MLLASYKRFLNSFKAATWFRSRLVIKSYYVVLYETCQTNSGYMLVASFTLRW